MTYVHGTAYGSRQQQGDLGRHFGCTSIHTVYIFWTALGWTISSKALGLVSTRTVMTLLLLAYDTQTPHSLGDSPRVAGLRHSLERCMGWKDGSICCTHIHEFNGSILTHLTPFRAGPGELCLYTLKFGVSNICWNKN